MKKTCLIILSLLLVLPTVLAVTEYEDLTVPINLSIKNDKNGTCAVQLSSQNDDVRIYPKKFDCWDNTTFEDIEVNFQSAIAGQTIVDNANLSKAMKNLTTQYYEFINYANYTRNYFDKYSEMKSAHDLVTERYTVCKEERDKIELASGNLSEKYTACDDELTNANAERDSSSEKLSVCTKELTKAQSDKTTWAVGALLLGILGTYFAMNRKKPKTDESQHFGSIPEGFPRFEEMKK